MIGRKCKGLRKINFEKFIIVVIKFLIVFRKEFIKLGQIAVLIRIAQKRKIIDASAAHQQGRFVGIDILIFLIYGNEAEIVQFPSKSLLFVGSFCRSSKDEG